MTKTAKKTAFKIGLILGVILILVSSIIHLTDLQLITNTWLGVANVALNVAFGMISIILVKNHLGSFITFKEAFSAYFITLLTGSMFSTLFILIYYNFIISQEDIEIIKEIMINFNLDMMKNNATPEEIENTRKLSNDYDPANSGYIIKSGLFYLVRDCIIGFLVALALKNKSSI